MRVDHTGEDAKYLVWVSVGVGSRRGLFKANAVKEEEEQLRREAGDKAVFSFIDTKTGFWIAPHLIRSGLNKSNTHTQRKSFIRNLA